MKSNVEQLEPTRVKITLDLEWAELKPAVDTATKHMSQQVNIPGFRRGKVPTRVLENHLGRGAIIEHAVNDSLDSYYQQAIAENELSPIGQPSVDITQWPNLEGPAGGTLTIVIEVDTRPEINLPELSGITLTTDKPVVTDEDIEESLTEMRERFATLKTVDRPVEPKDFVSIDMEAKIGDEVVDSVSGISYQLGSGQLLEGIDEALEGLQAEETTTFKSTLAGGEHEGEEADVTVTVQSVKESELPEADDDFAQLASEFDTIEEFKEDLRTTVEKTKLTETVYAARDLLLEELNKQLDVPVPAGVIDQEIKRHLEAEGKEEGDPHGEEIREDTEKAFRDQMILDAIVEKLEVEIGQDELLEFMVQQAQMYNIEPNQFIQAAAQTNQVSAFASELTRNKALILSLREVTVVDQDGEPIDVKSVIDENEGTADEEAADAADETVTEETEEAVTEEAADKAPEAEEEKVEEKPAAKKAPAKKPAAKKAPAKKAETEDAKAEAEADAEEKPAAKKAPAKKPAAKKAPAKKPAAKKAPAKKAEAEGDDK
ncbi:trigger factor [Flaviflexus massiliensis]|uniref:trigger factor n=1 Tax=Flaviflexus massiliensis TaxID=1522309 RepID=UPI0006D54452|nr:trigger factor [Flaviflexus massiliensis]